jgi:GTPase SAR1 family protein
MNTVLIHHHFPYSTDPHMGDECRHDYKIPNTAQLAKLELIDFPGQEEFTAMKDLYYRSGIKILKFNANYIVDGFIILFDWSTQSSYDEVISTMEAIYRTVDTQNVPILIIG